MPHIAVDPSGSQCVPDPAPADPGVATIFTFTLVNPGLWEWVGPSPVVVNNDAGQFIPSYIDPRGNKVVLVDMNMDAALYKYSVKVRNKSTGVPMTIDPFIQNQ